MQISSCACCLLPRSALVCLCFDGQSTRATATTTTCKQQHSKQANNPMSKWAWPVQITGNPSGTFKAAAKSFAARPHQRIIWAVNWVCFLLSLISMNFKGNTQKGAPYLPPPPWRSLATHVRCGANWELQSVEIFPKYISLHADKYMCMPGTHIHTHTHICIHLHIYLYIYL